MRFQKQEQTQIVPEFRVCSHYAGFRYSSGTVHNTSFVNKCIVTHSYRHIMFRVYVFCGLHCRALQVFVDIRYSILPAYFPLMFF